MTSSKNVTFWPVGNGDSSTIKINEDVYIQIDLNHTESSEENNDPRIPIIDELVKELPTINEKPYLSLFILTHPDEDHCKGFSELLDKVDIGEIWFSPRIFNEYKKELCEDATAFKEEVERRVEKIIDDPTNLESGDLVRIIGYSEVLEEDYEGFPEDLLTIPGNSISTIDLEDLSEDICIFIHSPFKHEIDTGDRNETSLGFQLTLKEDDNQLKLLFFGDLTYLMLQQIFEISNKPDLEWNILIAPHHCSKSVMYWDNEEGEEELKQDIIDSINDAQLDNGYIISLSNPVPATNSEGDNPPHAKAKNRYEEIVNNDFICTMEYKNEDTPEPLIFTFDNGSISYDEADNKVDADIAEKIKKARGDDEPPKKQVGFGPNE